MRQQRQWQNRHKKTNRNHSDNGTLKRAWRHFLKIRMLQWVAPSARAVINESRISVPVFVPDKRAKRSIYTTADKSYYLKSAMTKAVLYLLSGTSTSFGTKRSHVRIMSPRLFQRLKNRWNKNCRPRTQLLRACPLQSECFLKAGISLFYGRTAKSRRV